MAATPNSGPVIRVLLVDDDRDDYLLTRELLGEIPDTNFQLDWCGDFETGLDAICRGEHDVYLLDYSLGVRTGLDLLREAQQRRCTGPVILLTGHGTGEVDQAALEAGAADFLEKGRLDATLLARSIRYALQQSRAEAELELKVQERTQELAKVNETLRQADQRKNEFLATLAHELRNPLAPIRNSVEILRRSIGQNPAADKALDILQRQVRQMVRLIDDLLDISRISRGKLKLQFERIDLREPLELAIETSRPIFEEREVELHATIPDEQIIFTADRVRLAQVIANLLNNGAKYTQSGGMVRLVGERRGNMVVIRVADNGNGIDPKDLGSIFDIFSQVTEQTNRQQDGLGIGLALVRAIVEMHGGTITAASNGIDQGSEFLLEMPIDRKEIEQGAAPAEGCRPCQDTSESAKA